MNLIDVQKRFKTDDDCLDYLEHSRWPDGVRCITCGAKEISRITRASKSRNKRTRLYQCLEPTCKEQFSATQGTIFHRSHLPLTTWFAAVALIVDAEKGMSAIQLQRHLGIGSYKNAWYLSHRIREAMIESGPKLKGIVEIDETYIGGRHRGHKGKLTSKDAVIGIRERGGPLRFIQANDQPTKGLVYDIISKHVAKEVELIVTDDSQLYGFDETQYRGKHKVINHSKYKYARRSGKDLVHTNTIENAFSLLKRGIIGNFHQVSIKHLQRYLNEFGFRFNRREIATRWEETIQRLVAGKSMPFRALVADPS